MGWLLYRLFA